MSGRLSSTTLQESGNRAITQEDLKSLRQIDDIDAADVLDARIRYLENQHRTTFLEIGCIVCEMEERQLWSKLTDENGVYFTSLEKWLASAAKTSRSNAYAAMRVVREMKDVPMDQLADMPRHALETMSRLSSNVRQDPAIIEAAKTLSEDDFIRHIQKGHPDQHVESRKPMHLKPLQGGRGTIELALKVAMWVFDSDSREGGLEALSADFLDAYCTVEGYEHLSMRQAYEQAVNAGDVKGV